ncbi:hypothetical protein GH714_018996 [Hevea brasiliensis]|uniref:E3 ubiquitin protein ligase n=1 Tax=Hevea brasiliensis TaxID=3981 RepID=A0A6A6LTG0_HEVBR|nr:hypothetical protein GH714_018996 [Hevea brasiliensis]
MGSTGEPDRKRRHFSSISPMAAMAKKQPFSQSSEDKKLDTAVLQFQNQKLVQKLEAQKVEYSALVNKFSQLKEKQQPNNSILKSVHKSWELLVTDLEACSTCTRESSIGQDIGRLSITEDGVSSSFEEAFLSRLVETGATETSSANDCLNSTEEHKENASEKIKNILCADRQKESCGLVAEVKNLRLALSDLHLKHKSHARELQSCRDINAKNKAELKRLKGELESAVSELEESNLKMATLKAERDATKGTFFPVLNLGSKPVPGDRARDKQKNLQEMESALKELQDEASSRLLKLKGLHDERITILQQLSNLQDSLKNVKCISSSQAYRLLRDQLEKSKSEVFQYQALYEKLQVERDNLSLRENELNVKNDLVDLFRRSSAVVDSRIADLGIEIQRQINERHVIETKLEEASGELGRKEIIAEFKALVSSFPEAMGNMQRQLSTYKEATSDIHSLRADVQSLSTVLDRKVKECENLSTRSKNQVAEIQKLQSVVQDLKESDLELKLILEMYRFESTDSRDVMEAKDLEYKAWAQVQSLKSFLDEQNLELRVKTANEAEAISQRLATTEADIADLRQRLEASKRDISRLSDVLKSKNEENEAYLSEIEVHKLKEEKFQNSSTLENTQKRLVDVRKSSNQARESLEDSQSKVGRSRAALLELQIELERERFDKRRIEEELEVARRKVSRLRAQTEGSSIVEKLQQELKEYREIVKCSICLERPKEVDVPCLFYGSGVTCLLWETFIILLNLFITDIVEGILIIDMYYVYLSKMKGMLLLMEA